MDEDEEALRAILLASLPKRTKSANSVPNSSTVTTIPAVSNSTNQIIANQFVPKVVQSMVNTATKTNNNSTAVPSKLHGNSEPENDKNQSNSGGKVRDTIAQSSVPLETVKTPTSVTSGRKRSISACK